MLGKQWSIEVALSNLKKSWYKGEGPKIGWRFNIRFNTEKTNIDGKQKLEWRVIEKRYIGKLFG